MHGICIPVVGYVLQCNQNENRYLQCIDILHDLSFERIFLLRRKKDYQINKFVHVSLFAIIQFRLIKHIKLFYLSLYSSTFNALLYYPAVFVSVVVLFYTLNHHKDYSVHSGPFLQVIQLIAIQWIFLVP